MKLRLLVEIEVEVKDNFYKMESTKSSDRGSQLVERITTPTQADVESTLIEQLERLHPSASVDKFFPFIPGKVTIKETTISSNS